VGTGLDLVVVAQVVETEAASAGQVLEDATVAAGKLT